jgi:hypothetical protein
MPSLAMWRSSQAESREFLWASLGQHSPRHCQPFDIAAASGRPVKRALLVGLDAFRQVGFLHDFEPGKRELFLGAVHRCPPRNPGEAGAGQRRNRTAEDWRGERGNRFGIEGELRGFFRNADRLVFGHLLFHLALQRLESRGPSRIRTGDGGFAIRCLTAWRRGPGPGQGDGRVPPGKENPTRIGPAESGSRS